MNSFIFNSFKEKLMNGEINAKDTWKAWPVNSKFVDENPNLAYYNTSADFATFNSAYKTWDEYQSTIYPVVYKYYPMIETDKSSEPEFVTKDSFPTFFENTQNSEHPELVYQKHLYSLFFDNSGIFYRVDHTETEINVDGEEISVDIPRGFYYVRTIEELKWCAEKVNGITNGVKTNNYNNTINIVLGDNIGTYVSELSACKNIDFSIGSYRDRPYNGIFFGNGFNIEYVNLICNSDVNGIVGNLGTSGVLHTISICGDNILTCNKKISIDHLTTSGTDIAAGLLCGKNDGIIQNLKIDGNVYYNGFYPKIYSIKSKTDTNGDKVIGDQNSNIFYPDYLCFNSIGNIIPYIGYFNEGVFATYSAENIGYWNTTIGHTGTIKHTLNNDSDISPQEWYYWNATYDDDNTPTLYGTPTSARTNVLYYDSTIVKETNRLVANEPDLRTSNLGILNFPDISFYNNDVSAYIANEDTNYKNITAGQYFNKSIKMSQFNRQAYYISPAIGINNGQIEIANINVNFCASGTFVGFAGGLAGKYNNGYITHTTVNLSANDLLTDDPNGMYKRNYFSNLGELEEGTEEDSKPTPITDQYHFKQKSIHNIGALFGMYVVGPYTFCYRDINGNYITSTDPSNLVSVSAYLHNMHTVPYKDGVEVNDDYAFMNRFGTIAAIVDLNSCNISDKWNNNIELNDDEISRKFANLYNCSFKYTELNQITFNNTADNNTYIGYGTYILSHLSEEVRNTFNANNYMCGVASPMFAEIKPTFLSVPSIISTPASNACVKNGEQIVAGYYDENGDNVTVENIDENTYTGLYPIQTSGRVGIFTVDQNFASPYSDPNFWCINTDVDIPGVANSYVTSPIMAEGYASDMLTPFIPDAENMSLDIKSLAKKIFAYTDVSFVNTYNVKENIFGTVTVPQNAQLDLSNNAYSAMKKLTTYPYFGSDLELILNKPNEICSEIKQYVYNTPDNPTLDGTEASVFVEGIYNLPQIEGFTDNTFMLHVNFKEPSEESGDNTPVKMSSINNDLLPLYSKINFVKGKYPYLLSGGMVEPEEEINNKISYFYNFIYGTCDNASINTDKKYMMIAVTDIDTNLGNNKYILNVDDEYIKCVAKVQKAIFIPVSNDKQNSVMMLENVIAVTNCYLFEKIIDDVKYYGIYFGEKMYYTNYNVYNINNLAIKYTNMNYFVLPMKSSNVEVNYDSTFIKVINPVGWANLSYSGKFKNSLVNSNSGNVEGIKFIDNTFENYPSVTSLWFDGTTENEVTSGLYNNRQIAKYGADTISGLKDYFKYSYYKTVISADIAASGLDIPVKYGLHNEKAGFWFIDNNKDGDWNDDLTYNGNVLSIGKTVNENCIMNKHLTKKNKSSYITSGISADDFEGLYITDSKHEPVMYIDVGLGECSEGTSWSLSSYPSDTGKNVSGLLLEMEQ